VLQTPLRALATLRPNVPAVVLVASAVSTVVFSATPFLIPGIADVEGVPVGRVGLISTLQLGGFVVSSWGAGRILRPRRRVMVIAILLGLVANVASGLVGFSLLLPLRFLAGISLGTVAWISWSEVFGDEDRSGDVAVVGPIVGSVAAPVIASVIDASGPEQLFFLLGALHLVPLVFIRTARFAAPERPRSERHRPVPAAFVLLVALGLLTLGGNSVFVFAGAIGSGDIGLSPIAVALVFSLNSLASIPSARRRGPHRHAGQWVGVAAAMAVLVASIHHPVVFTLALGVWGFAFWMGVPAAFALLARNSRYPAERAGDSQAYMALGRVVGPLVGGALYEVHPTMLGVVGGGIMVVAAVTFAVIDRRTPSD
jgi:MFS family permease